MQLPNKLKLPELPFSVSDLEPCLSAETIETHYFGHHNGYVENFNKLIDSNSFDIDSLLHNFYGVELHNLYWDSLSPVTLHPGPLTRKILTNSGFKSQNSINTALKHTLQQHRGSGWTLVLLVDNLINIRNIPNQELDRAGVGIPLLAIDAFEHAYYLDYKNKKLNYYECILHHLNWRNVEEKIISIVY